MSSYKLPIDKQQKIFIDIIRKNPVIKDILDNGFVEDIPDWYLVAGCLNQTIWNYLTNKDLQNNIDDYDLIYFDNDTSYEKEDKIIKTIYKKYEHLGVNLDIKNQARVHLWVEDRFKLKINPLASAESAIASWPVTVACIGIRKEKGTYTITAPYGLTDNLEMILRPNKTTVMRESDFNYKTAKWLAKWPELTLIPW